ncbi:hypothetical protein GCM10022226_64250 [Sphaerisporangium flaviroseum]|uniref:Lasso RiPP family leader peptide-containing protein n=1 Tax=Sphaerisporangium flaviroseum TaxID=509199 RepID=A0ABP7J3N4_9ACTN
MTDTGGFEADVPGEGAGRDEPDPIYEPPVLIRLGRLRDQFRGSSSSGNADANSQYYY